MKQIAWALILVAFGVPPVTATDLTVERTARQTVQGWGLTIAPADWDGRPQLTSPEMMKTLLGSSHASVVRIVVNGGLYREDLSRLDQGRADSLLGPSLDAIRENGIRKYIISFHSPPNSMKTYFNDAGEVHFDPNSLRPDRARDFVDYVAAVLSYSRRRVGWAPVGVILATRPDINDGCAYTPEQWRSLLALAGPVIVGQGLPPIAILGPETATVQGLHDFLDLGAEGGNAPVAGSAVTDVAISGEPTSDIGSESDALLIRDLASCHKFRKPVWLIDCGPDPRLTESQLLPGTFSALGRDLVLIGADYWIWRYGYSNLARRDSLYWGQTLGPSPISLALTRLWQLAPAGSSVHRVRSIETDSPRIYPSSVEAFALVYGHRLVITIANREKKPRIYRLTCPESESAQCSIYSTDYYKENIATYFWNHIATISLPPESVGIIESGY